VIVRKTDIGAGVNREWEQGRYLKVVSGIGSTTISAKDQMLDSMGNTTIINRGRFYAQQRTIGEAFAVIILISE